MIQPVAILCAAPKSVYHQIPGCDVFDKKRDARTFLGGTAIIAHPPCRLWSAFCRHQAKSPNPDEEKELGRFCVKQVEQWGVVLEQPAHSRLFGEMNLPSPKDRLTSIWSWSIEVPQFWFGDTREKSTWLWFNRILKIELPQMPLRLKPEGGDRRIWQLMSSKNQRERTPLEFAQWLVACVRMTK